MAQRLNWMQATLDWPTQFSLPLTIGAFHLTCIELQLHTQTNPQINVKIREYENLQLKPFADFQTTLMQDPKDDERLNSGGRKLRYSINDMKKNLYINLSKKEVSKCC